MTQNLSILGTPIFIRPERPDVFRDQSGLLIVTDETCSEKCLAKLLEKVSNLVDVPVIVLSDGEKDLGTVRSIIDELISLQADRYWTIIKLGGGTICDLGGFAAGIYKRGIGYVNVPTSLLAMADASVGGKTACDHRGIRNALGAFHQPKAVWIDSAFLRTLNEQQLREGMAEIVKNGVLEGGELWKLLQKDVLPPYDELILASLKVKKAFVEADPNDANQRKALNFGHTIAHALESADAELPHGVAVAIGMMAEAHLSKAKTGFSEPELAALTKLISRHCKTIWKNGVDVKQIVPFLYHDKKNMRGKLRLTLLKRIGKPKLDVDCIPAELIQALEATIKYAR